MAGAGEHWDEKKSKSCREYVASTLKCWVQTIRHIKSVDLGKKIEHLDDITQEIEKGKKLVAENKGKDTIYPFDLEMCDNQVQKLEALKKAGENPRKQDWLKELVEKFKDTPWKYCSGECLTSDCDCVKDCCSMCEEPMDDTIIYCGKCGNWYHRKCLETEDNKEYDKYLSKQQESYWFCYNCKLRAKGDDYGHRRIAIGNIWPSRIACSKAGIHRHHGAGICPGPRGAYAICVNEGYEDNLDRGNYIIYTGSGGQDNTYKKLGPQTKNQDKTMSESTYNASLYRSLYSKKPVRVIRGFEVKKPDHKSGKDYRYDGLYRVIDYAYRKGQRNFKVHKFLLERLSEKENPTPDELKEELDDLQGSLSEEDMQKQLHKDASQPEPSNA